MPSDDRVIRCDVAIVGGGIAALWILDALDEAGYAACLVEPWALGEGQTLSSQGIIHGGLKYTLRGLLSPSASAISAMPERWRRSLAGEIRPDLRSVRTLSPATWLWRSGSLTSKLAMIGARAGLRARPVEVDPAERPVVLRDVPGAVYRVDEPVLDTGSLVAAFRAEHAARMLAVAGPGGLRFEGESGLLIDGPDGTERRVRSDAVVLAAGIGNDDLRHARGLAPAMQRRPLHMVMLRGAELAELHGHCVDGAATRITVTSAVDRAGRRVWQIGGQLAERGVDRDEAELLAFARDELHATLPGFRDDGLEWASYRIDRAERSAGGVRPDDAQCLVEGPTLTVWPTKLALAPRAAALVLEALAARGLRPRGERLVRSDLAPPPLGAPPWEAARWRTLDGVPPRMGGGR